MALKLQVVTHVLLVFCAIERRSQAVPLTFHRPHSSWLFFSCVYESTGARSLSLWCTCRARYTDLSILLMRALTGRWKHCSGASSKDVLCGLAASQRVFLWWPSVASLVAVFSRKNKNDFCFYSSVTTTTDAPFPFVFLLPLFVNKYFLKTEGCHQEDGL